jgi:hypothetical protein
MRLGNQCGGTHVVRRHGIQPLEPRRVDAADPGQAVSATEAGVRTKTSKERTARSARPLVAPVALVVLVVTVAAGDPRYHTPGDLGLVVLAAVALDHLIPCRRSGSRPPVAFARHRREAKGYSHAPGHQAGRPSRGRTGGTGDIKGTGVGVEHEC